VEFAFIDDEKMLAFARETQGAKLKRWRTSTNKRIVAKQIRGKGQNRFDDGKESVAKGFNVWLLVHRERCMDPLKR